MPTITPLHPDYVFEARRVIYRVAHDLFHPDDSLLTTISQYESCWPLQDVIQFQEHYVDRDGIFLVMWEEGHIIATGALRRLEESIGEIKRVWLLTEYQGKGYGYQLMAALIQQARNNGYAKLRLETAPALQPRAYAFYHSLGFKDIPRYGNDPDDVGMELIL
jgi:GNAT superfamily N-acetyltransferase